MLPTFFHRKNIDINQLLTISQKLLDSKANLTLFIKHIVDEAITHIKSLETKQTKIR